MLGSLGVHFAGHELRGGYDAARYRLKRQLM
jgi:hypothetical protein